MPESVLALRIQKLVNSDIYNSAKRMQKIRIIVKMSCAKIKA